MGEQWGSMIRTERTAHYAATPAEIWAALERIDDYHRWWPWLVRFEANALADGDRWRCAVQPPLPYRVSFDLRLTDVVPCVSVAAAVDGDISGSARVELLQRHDLGGGTDLILVSRLTPSSRWLQLLNRVAGPVARFGHDQIVDTALKQFVDRAL